MLVYNNKRIFIHHKNIIKNIREKNGEEKKRFLSLFELYVNCEKQIKAICYMGHILMS